MPLDSRRIRVLRIHPAGARSSPSLLGLRRLLITATPLRSEPGPKIPASQNPSTPRSKPDERLT